MTEVLITELQKSIYATKQIIRIAKIENRNCTQRK